ncbi:eCIS core domain-containing protein [Lunatibacter salilacus]|uniref:eCIS core domain-containing protein n=1 Tax=Lunatibacter salilacus TaxID=2483804 RepID=UPI00131ABBC0|nr:DUF4157 domain-containing protein [Lunatibacter salilacus]
MLEARKQHRNHSHKIASHNEQGSFFAQKIQPKLTLNQPNDSYEQEADAMADKVMQMPDNHIMHQPFFKPSISLVQGKCANCEDEQEHLQRKQGYIEMEYDLQPPKLQRTCDECSIQPPEPSEIEEEEEEETADQSISPKSENLNGNSGTMDIPANFQNTLQRSQNSGVPLAEATRNIMESSFGQDFSHVRIHVGSDATSLNRQIQAKAFTYQNNIFFNSGNFNPGSKQGQHLLAHELTHVVQQTGGREFQPSLQRSFEPKIGNWAHAQIQQRLREKDAKLITEAPIPGGTRDIKAINTVGFADLYKAENQTVSGISGQEPQESKDLPEGSKFFKFVNMASNFKNRAKSKSGINFGPTIHKRTRKFAGNFPGNFHIGEIKPLFPTEFRQSLAYHGLGRLQVGNYIEGFQEFAKRVHTDNPQEPQLPATITGRPINIPDTNIPDAINYRKFEQERLKGGADGIYKRDKAHHERIWILKFKDGIYVYFLLPHPYTSDAFPKHLEDQLKKLNPLIDRLRKKRPAMNNTLGLKRDEGYPNATGAKPKKNSGLLTLPNPSIQAKGENWNELAKTWEVERKNWVKGTGTSTEKPKDFLKQQARGVVKKNKIDEKLGVTSSDSLIRQQIKSVGQIRFWSSLKGRFLGALRFRFGSAFDKVEELFEKIKEKFKKHHANSTKLNEKNGIFDGWKKVATKAIIRLGVAIFKDMVVLAFKGFIDCINGIINAISSRLTAVIDESKDEALEKIEPVCCEIMEFKGNLEREFEKHDKLMASFTETVETIREWRKILDVVEASVRIGVQIVSCGTPPALGCLWGLVAQLGISSGLSLLARTDYFEEEIAKPAARSLLDAVVGDSLHNFLIDVLESTPLQPFVLEAKTCARRNSSLGNQTIGGNIDKLDPNDPKNVKARAEWEQEYQGEILRDLQAVFEKGKGKKVTQEDLLKLVESMNASGKTPAEIKEMLMSARNPASGKLNLDLASATVKSGMVPEAIDKERKIDLEKAVRNNVVFQQLIGWDPLQFIKKPGIKADSTEFAEAVYDMQIALGLKPDGMLGEESVVRFYQRNNLKKDAIYKEALRQYENKIAEKEKAAEKEKTPEEKPSSPTYKVLNAADYPIQSGKFQSYPKFVRPKLPYELYEEIVLQRQTPAIISIDLYVHGVHAYRIQNVALKNVQFSELLATPTNIPLIIITLVDGFQLFVEGEEAIFKQLIWRYDK